MRHRLLAAPLMLCPLIAVGCSSVKPHEYRAARHVEIAQHAFIIQTIEDCEIADTESRGQAHYETGRQMAAYIGHLICFGMADRYDNEDWAQEDWHDLGANFPIFQSAAAEAPTGDAANRLPLLLKDEMVRISLQNGHRMTTSHYGSYAHDSVMVESDAWLPVDQSGELDEESRFQQHYRTTGKVTIEGPYGYADFDIAGSLTLSEFESNPDGHRTAKITDLRWTLITLDAPISIRLAPGLFDSRVSVDEFGLGEARLVVAFGSTDYPYLDDIYFNAVLNIPVAATADLKTMMLATPGSVPGTSVAPVLPLPPYTPTEDGGCADTNANGIPDYAEAQSRSLRGVRDLLLEP